MTEQQYKNKTYLSIDDGGDPVFMATAKRSLLAQKGFQPCIIIIMIETTPRQALRKAVADFIDRIR